MVLQTLRDRTASLHARAERSFDLPSRCRSIGAYSTLLARLLGFYRPIEHRLSAHEWSDAGLDFHRRRKAGLLETDLAVLGFADAEIGNVPACESLPRPATLASALGCLYVLEGATLGGRVIAREVGRALGVTPTTGGSFHAAYGDDAPAMWQMFRRAATAYCDAEPGRVEQAVSGAAATFEAFEAWLSSAGRQRA